MSHDLFEKDTAFRTLIPRSLRIFTELLRRGGGVMRVIG